MFLLIIGNVYATISGLIFGLLSVALVERFCLAVSLSVAMLLP